MTRRSALLAACLLLPCSLALAQSQDTTTEPRPVDPAADPVNRLVAAQTVSGLMVAIRIDGTKVTLERARPARIWRPRGKGPVPGDTVTVAALSGGTRIAEVTVPDRNVLVVEHAGLKRLDLRTVYAAVPTPRAIDAIEVRVRVGGVTERFDVRSAYDEICRLLPRDPVCAGRPETTR
jgi:hypothetical protein